MQKTQTHIIVTAVLAFISMTLIALTPIVARAASCTDSDGQTIETSVIDCNSVNSGRGIIWDILVVFINFLSAGVGIAVVAGIVFGAVTYASAGGSAEQAKKGITFVTNAVIALVLYIFMYAIINFLVPGGLF